MSQSEAAQGAVRAHRADVQLNSPLHWAKI